MIHLSTADLFKLRDGDARNHDIVAANFGGLTNRIRCLLTCASFTSSLPTICFGDSWHDNTLHAYDQRITELDVFNVSWLSRETFSRYTGAERGRYPGTYYDDWKLVTPSILKLPRSAVAYCFDALNADGLKSSSMLYYMPDSVYENLQQLLLNIFSIQFLQKIKVLEDLLRTLKYAVISMRFWRDCTADFRVSDPTKRLNVRIDEGIPDSIAGFIDTIAGYKWSRIPPSVITLRILREHLNVLGYKNIVLMADRFNGRFFCSGDTKIIEGVVSNLFLTNIERSMAAYFIIANSRVLCRSKDSTFNHLPILLNKNKDISLIDF